MTLDFLFLMIRRPPKSTQGRSSAASDVYKRQQEPGSAQEIQTFCSTTYGVTFPLLAKADVNGAERHPLYAELTRTADAEGQAGDVQWNFEKFLLAPDGRVVNRFRPRTEPGDPAVLAAIEAVLPA